MNMDEETANKWQDCPQKFFLKILTFYVKYAILYLH